MVEENFSFQYTPASTVTHTHQFSAVKTFMYVQVYFGHINKQKF